MPNVTADNPLELANARAWLDGQLAIDVKAVSINADSITITLTGGLVVERQRATARLMIDLAATVSSARREFLASLTKQSKSVVAAPTEPQDAIEAATLTTPGVPQVRGGATTEDGVTP